MLKWKIVKDKLEYITERTNEKYNMRIVYDYITISNNNYSLSLYHGNKFIDIQCESLKDAKEKAEEYVNKYLK